MRPATEIICIPFGRVRNCTEKEIRKQNFAISCRKICRCYMIQQKDRDMKFGIEVREPKGCNGGTDDISKKRTFE